MDTDQQDVQRAQRLRETADELRPPMQAFMDLIIDSTRTAAAMKGDPDEIWAATVINVARGLRLDVEDPTHMGAAMFVAEVVMKSSGIEG
jgi:hypothetical protein